MPTGTRGKMPTGTRGKMPTGTRRPRHAQAYLRHTEAALLKQYEGLVLSIERKLAKKVTLGCFDRRGELVKKGTAFGECTMCGMPCGVSTTFYEALRGSGLGCPQRLVLG
jgi:hypothetical protein